MFESTASLAIMLAAFWFATEPGSPAIDKPTVTLSYMVDTKNYGRSGSLSFASSQSLIDISVRSAPTHFQDLRFAFSAMYGGQGTYLLGPGFGKTVDLGKYEASLFIYPSYASIQGLDRQTASGHFNWKTTAEISRRINSKSRIGFGVMHISNGGYSKPNNGIEALSLTYHYDLD